jgi:hypothetical protein
MAQRRWPELSAWRRPALTTRPSSFGAWARLGAWEARMGILLYVALALGIQLIATAPASIVTVFDFTGCYAAPPIAQPCERVLYRAGTLNAALNVWCGLVLLAVAVFLLWDVWSAVAPKPIVDEFLKLVDDSFARDWRRPGTWPWKRVVRAYGFTLVGVAAAACVELMISAMITPSRPDKAPTVHVETSERFRLNEP